MQAAYSFDVPNMTRVLKTTKEPRRVDLARAMHARARAMFAAPRMHPTTKVVGPLKHMSTYSALVVTLVWHPLCESLEKHCLCLWFSILRVMCGMVIKILQRRECDKCTQLVYIYKSLGLSRQSVFVT